jgi:hypothetical protein
LNEGGKKREEDTKRALRRHWTTSGGRDWEVVPKAEGVDLEKRRDVMSGVVAGWVMDVQFVGILEMEVWRFWSASYSTE